jgi:serine protease AprX
MVAACTAVATVAATAAPTASAPPSTTQRVLLSIVDDRTTPAQVADAVTRGRGVVVAAYPVADALLVELPVGASAPSGTVAVADVPLRVSSTAASVSNVDDVQGATYRATIHAPDAAAGAGVTVALVDTGVAPVADLAGRVRHVNVSGGDAGDGLGHGTFMAGLIAGNGISSGGAYHGVAPAARILDVQVAAADGSTSLSRVLAGLQVVADTARTDGSLRVVSLALSTGNPLPPSSDPFARALDRLWATGLTVVVSAGNDGPAAATVTTPGADATLITVGSLDEHSTSARGDDTVSEFSSRGTDFGTQKPDLVAPGTSLVSARASGSLADVEHPEARVLDAYFRGSGTSMSEAVTAGAAAVLISSRPALTPDAVKRVLTSTAYRNAALEKRDGAGAGGLDLGAALSKAATTKLVLSARSAQDPVTAIYGPDVADADTWQQFSDAWAAGDLAGVAAAWSRLSEQTRRWAATAFSLELMSTNAGTGSADYAALESMARAWSTQAWEARAWSSDLFVSRTWSARAWSARAWSLDTWSARAWSDSGWSARAWSDANWDARAWSDGQWTARAWSARAWSAEDWSARAWSARAWTQVDWLAFAWSARAWSARAWSADAWSARAWSARAWSARAWSELSWSARSWSVGDWDARAWSVSGWSTLPEGSN